MKRFALTTIACLCTQAFAETLPENTAPVQELPKIKVTADRENKPFQTPSAASHIKPDELGRDLNEVIRSMSNRFQN